MPSRYYSAWDEDTRSSVLVLEDMSPAQAGDNLAGCTVETAKSILEQLAGFHGRWWNSSRLRDLTWLTAFDETWRFNAGEYSESWGPFVAYVGDKLSAESIAIGEKIGKSIHLITGRLTEHPETLLHGDFHLDNMLFTDAEQGKISAVIDWELVSRGLGAFDVGYFFSRAISTADRRSSQTDLLKAYHDALIGQGGWGYSFDELFFDDFRLSWLCTYMSLVYAVAETTGPSLSAGMTVVLERTVAAPTDLNVEELLPR